MNLFITQLFEDPQRFFIWLLVVIFSICCHEFMHAWAALKQGDPTAADEGHLTLNPMKQMGPFSLVMLAVCGIAWGRVPVRPWQMAAPPQRRACFAGGTGHEFRAFPDFRHPVLRLLPGRRRKSGRAHAS